MRNSNVEPSSGTKEMVIMPILNCSFKFLCGKAWAELEAIYPERDSIRYCNECGKDVHLVTTEHALRTAVEEGHCVAVPGMPYTSEAEMIERSTGPLVGMVKLNGS